MNQPETLLRVVELSDQILSAIDKEDWDSVASVDDERRRLLDEYYKNSTDIDKQLTRILKQKNDEIISRLVDIRQHTRTQKITLTQAQNASKAYLENT